MVKESAIGEKEVHAQQMETMARLAGGVAHDFNNLLTVIIGCSDVLHQKLKGDDSLQKYTSEIQRAAERATKLNQQLMSFNKRGAVEPKVIEVNAFIRTHHPLLKRLCGSKIESEFDADKDLCPVRVEEALLEQLVFNCVNFSAARMKEGGHLTVSTRMVQLRGGGEDSEAPPAGHYLKLVFKDSAPMLSKDEKSHMIEKNVAMATCFNLAKAMAGYTMLESSLEGTALCVYLSAIDKSQLQKAQKEEEAAALTKAEGSGAPSILLVEDETKLRELVQDVLLSSGFQVTSASNGKEGVDLVKARKLTKVDLILTDVIMPQMSGKEMVDLIKPLLPEAKIIFMSGYTDDALAPHGVLESDMTLIQKPFLAKDLVKRIREVLA